ncbi:MAG: hypothetical protein MMC33_008221 [Icmadophila ericetorum]|nr:hypothetical protein [Icmadophila ericetorum]
MDPVTAIGLLASVANLIQASDAILEVMKSFKDGERELLELCYDVSVFEEALKGFDRVLRSRQTRHNISGSVINSALEDGFATIQELDKRALIRTKRETFLRVCSQHPQFMEICSTKTEETDSDATSFQSSTLSDATSLVSRRSGFSSRRASLDTLATSLSLAASLDKNSLEISSTPSSDSVTRGKVLRGMDQEESSIEKSSSNVVTIRRACRFNCFCECHVQSTLDSSRGSLKTKFGKNPCTEPSCRTSNLTTEKAHTAAFFRNAIAQVISSKNIKLRYNLNTYRMVSEGSDAMRYVKHGQLDKLKACMISGEATLWDTAPDGWSLLHMSSVTAAYNRQLPIVKYLLELGADTEVADVGTRKPADLAILKSLAADAIHIEREIVEVFSQKDDYIDDFDFTPIHIAVLEIYKPTDRERPTLQQLIEFTDDANNAPAGTDWDKWKLRYQKRSPLYCEIIELFRASTYERPKTYKVINNLIDRKDKKYSWTPLHWASSAGRTDKMNILMEYGADPFILSNLDANILHAAAESKMLAGLVGALEIWKRFPGQLNINQANRWSETPLHVAAWGSVGCVKLLLEAGADRNARQEDQQVPLHCTGLSERGEVRRETVALLCGNGQDNSFHINAQDVDGRPSIFDFLDDPKCLELLVRNGAKLDLLDNSGMTVFHHACIQDEMEALKTLLQFIPSDSVLITVKDHNGNTPLLQALCQGSTDTAQILLERDDVGDIVGQGGWTAAHHAAKLGDIDVLRTVLAHPSFVKGMRTIDGKNLETVAMEAGKWSGEFKGLLRRYDSKVL